MSMTMENEQTKVLASARMERYRRRGDAGYTLLELLVVMGILAVLTAVATPQLMGYFGKVELAAHGIVLLWLNIALMMPIGLSSAAMADESVQPVP